MYFGQKTSSPSNKCDIMQTDCGGAVITQSTMTYGQADELAASTNLDALNTYMRSPYNRSRFPSCYWKPDNGRVYMGQMYWVIYSYLAYNQIIAGKWDSYNNAMEYLFDKILTRFAAGGYVKSEPDSRFFDL